MLSYLSHFACTTFSCVDKLPPMSSTTSSKSWSFSDKSNHATTGENMYAMQTYFSRIAFAFDLLKLLIKKIKHIHVVFVLVLYFSFLSFPFLCWILLNTCCVFVSICCFSAKIRFVFAHFPLFQLLEYRNTTKYGIQNHAFLLKKINILLVFELVLPISFRCCTLLNTCWILLSTC